MRNLLALFAAFLLIVGGTGWYRGWYAVEPASADLGKIAFRVEIDRLQIARDGVDAVKALQRLTSGAAKDESKDDKAKEKTAEATK